MIREIINYTKHLKENSPMVFRQNLELRHGIYFMFEVNKKEIKSKGEPIYNIKKREANDLALAEKVQLSWTLDYEVKPYYQKCFDLPQKRIHSISPFLIAFKRQYLVGGKEFNNGKCVDEKKVRDVFKKCISYTLSDYNSINLAEKFREKVVSKLNSLTEDKLTDLANDDYVIFVLDLPKSEFDLVYTNYIKLLAFNSSKENLFDIDGNKLKAEKAQKEKIVLGTSNFMNGYSSNKLFKQHQTGYSLLNKLSNRETKALLEFKDLLKRKIFPKQLPIFVDKKEFATTDQILRVISEDSKLTYPQILKKLYNEKSDLVLQNYYLLFFNYKYEIEDFDFVTRFRYHLKKDGQKPKIKNIFGLKKNKEVLSDYTINHIFHFEADIVGRIFNNSLVKVKEGGYSTSYFGEIKPEFVSGGEPVYQMIMKYRKAFYDYIYKSKKQAINSRMWDEILWNSIISDLRNDTKDRKGYSTREYGIKQKLNAWFSLYNLFTNNKNRTNMASKIPEFLEKMKIVANNDNEVLATTDEFAFASGQVIYFLLNQSKASERTHALLEPFLQKVNIVQLQNSIAQAINTYKHEISFGKGRFEKLAAQVLAYESEENLKDHLRLILAGYFAPAVIYEKKETTN